MEATMELKQAVRECREGKTEAFTRLYEESSKYIYTCIYNAMRGNDNVEDAVCDIMQDTYVEISRSITKLDNEDSFLSWAAKIAVRKCYAWLACMVPASVTAAVNSSVTAAVSAAGGVGSKTLLAKLAGVSAKAKITAGIVGIGVAGAVVDPAVPESVASELIRDSPKELNGKIFGNMIYFSEDIFRAEPIKIFGQER